MTTDPREDFFEMKVIGAKRAGRRLLLYLNVKYKESFRGPYVKYRMVLIPVSGFTDYVENPFGKNTKYKSFIEP